MTVSLPAALQAFFDGKNAEDPARATAKFAPTAVVVDENHRYADPAAIADWIAATSAEYHDRSVVRSIDQQGERYTVIAEVSGDFPGSPADLTYIFTVVDGKITSLEID